MTETEIVFHIISVQRFLERLAKKALLMDTRLSRWVQEEDLVQEIVIRTIKACRAIELNDDQHLTRLLLLQLRRAMVDYHRSLYGPNGWALKIKSDPQAIHLMNASSTPNKGGPPVTVEQWIDFYDSVDELPENLREVFELKFFCNATDQTIAKRLQISERTVRRYWSTAMDTLQKKIDTHVKEDTK